VADEKTELPLRGESPLTTAVAAIEHLMKALNEPYIPGPKERGHLQEALFQLLCARDLRDDLEPDEETSWCCGSMKMGGVDRGAWEIVLRSSPDA
jgi:hypothetical protein